MSLKGFHIVFVSASLLLFTFLVVWGFLIAPENTSLSTTIGYVGVSGVLILPFYGIYFWRKATRIHL